MADSAGSLEHWREQAMALAVRVTRLEAGIARAVALLPDGATRSGLRALIPNVDVPEAKDVLRGSNARD